MKYTYDTLTIETGLAAIRLEALRITEAFNRHGRMDAVFLAEEEHAKEELLKSREGETVRVLEGGTVLFCGRLSFLRMEKQKGQTMLVSRFESHTARLDEALKDRAVTGADLTSTELLSAILQPYGTGFINTLSKGEPFGRFLLQYGETDWAFLKRLAAREGGVLTPDAASASGQFWYGLPDLNQAPLADEDGMLRTALRFEEYAKKNAAEPGSAFLPDSMRFVVKSRENYRLGQPVSCGNADCVIHRVLIEGAGGRVVKTYEAGTVFGILSADPKNPRYAGLHLAASVKEVKDTRVRLSLSMEQLTGGKELYFSYAAESSAWYCMPEQGSRVHLYLPGMDESEAYAVHSLRNTGAGAKHAASVSDPSVKSFTHPGGSAMQLDGNRMFFTADGTEAVSASVGGDGTLKLKAKQIRIQAGGKVRIGAGEPDPAKTVDLSAKLAIKVLNEKGISAYLGEQLYLKGRRISYTASVHAPVEIPDAILHRNDGIEEKIAAVNAAAEAMERQKVQEAKQKTGMGLFAIVAGVVAIATVAVAISAVSVLTCGAGLAVVGAVAGTVAIGCGAGLMQEGVSDYKKAVESGDFSQSYNFMRDGVLGGNQALYDVLTYGSVLVCGIVVGTVTGGASWQAFGKVALRAGTEMGLDAAMNLVMDYCDDGCINNGLDTYLKSACMTGGVSGLSMGVMDQFEKLKKAGKLSCRTLSNIRLGVDVTLDSIVSFATTGDVNLVKIFLQNYIANKLTLADPVDGATGSLYIPAVDLSLPDAGESYKISRKYESVNTRCGLLGRGWTISLESRLYNRSDQVHVLCADGHVESFRLNGGAYRNEKGGSLAVTLQREDEGWRMEERRERKTYFYGRDGRLLEVKDRHGNRSRYEYDKDVLTAVTTFTGQRIEVFVEDGKLRQLKDVLGRTFAYEYEGEFLVRTSQNGRGITRYRYDEGGRITEITDQNNRRYTVNRFDGLGRVISQSYPDGTGCEIRYEEETRCAVFTYPENGRTETVCHDGNGLVTRIVYQDGTSEEYGYDAWQNRVFEKDRNGGVTKREYDAYGHKVREEEPGGLIRLFAYDAHGNLLKERDNEGGCIRYGYDERGNLSEKRTLAEGSHTGDGEEPWDWKSPGPEACASQMFRQESQEASVSNRERNREAGSAEIKADAGHGRQERTAFSEENLRSAVWITERYGHDRRGRLLWKEDGRGNRTAYTYREGNQSFQPDLETSPEGYEFRYRYDAAGRKVGAETALGSVSYGYNSLHYATRTTDGEGNLTHEEYDNLGNLIRRDTPRLSRGKLSGAAGYRYAYDYLDRLVKVTDPLGREKRYVRDGQGNIVYESPLAYPRLAPEREPEAGEGACIRYRYDANGNRTSAECPDGGVFETRYDAKGNLLWETKAEQKEPGKRYAYDAMDRVVQIREEEGNVQTAYLYDKKGRVVRETDALGYQTFYRYDLAGRLTGKWEQALKEAEEKAQYRVTCYRYDAAGNCTEERKGLFAVKPFALPRRFASIQKAYDRENRLVRVEDGNGAVMEYAYDLRNNVVLERSLVQEGMERLVRYGYDRNGRLTEKRELLESGIPGREKREAVTAYGYDANGNLTALTLPEGGKIRLIYDEADRPVCRLEEDAKHGIKRATAYLYATACPFPWEELYGKTRSVKEFNRLLMEWEPGTGEEGRSGNRRLWEAVFAEKPAAVRYYAGKKATGIYHALERAYADISVFDPERGSRVSYGEAGQDYFERRFRYDFRGNLVTERDAEGNERAYCYNKNGELVKAIEPEEFQRAGWEAKGTTYRYDARGNRTGRINGEGETEVTLSYDGLGRVCAETDGEGNVTSYAYDPLGNLLQVRGPDGETDWSASYDLWGRIESETDGEGNTTRYEKDRWGRVTCVLRPDGGKERFSYDYAGNIIKAMDALGRETVFAYTSRGQTSSIRKADGTKEYFLYDLEGRCSGRLDESGCLTEAFYNMDTNPVRVTGRRLTGEEQKAYLLETPEERRTWEKTFHRPAPVPEAQKVYEYTPEGQLESAGEGGTVYRYAYDRNGRMVRKEAWGKTLVSCAYDGNGRVREVRTPGGITSYAYDLAGRLKKASGEDGLRASYRYTKHGMESEILYGNGLLTSKGYDERKRLVSLKTSFEGKEPLFTARYRYDRNGNRIRKEECISGRNETTDYGYDCLGQLTSEERSGRSARYGYDPAGNRVRKETAGGTERYRYNERNQLLERADGKKTIQYQYDPAGNLTGEWQVKNTEGNIEPLELDICYQYDVFRRNTEVKGTGYLQKNRYDAEGYRYETEENGKVSRYVYHNGMLLAELNEVNEKTAGQCLGNAYIGGRLALKAGRNQTAEAKQASENAQDKHAGVSPEQKTCYYVSDEQGSVRYVVDETGAVLNRYEYDAFGVPEAEEETCQNRLCYNGQIYDALKGQYYLRARYYQPDVGRFTQEDALYADGLNLYAYCKSNPVMYCDPSGLKKKKCEVNEAENNAGSSSTGRSEVQRDKWKEYTGTDPKGEVHHGLPEQYSDWFEARGIDVNSGEFYYDLPKDKHRLKSGNGIHTNNSPLGQNWNKVWKSFIANNPNASKEAILKQLEKMEKSSGIGIYKAIKK